MILLRIERKKTHISPLQTGI